MKAAKAPFGAWEIDVRSSVRHRMRVGRGLDVIEGLALDALKDAAVHRPVDGIEGGD